MDMNIVTHIPPNLPLSTTATRAPYKAARRAEAVIKTPLSLSLTAAISRTAHYTNMANSKPLYTIRSHSRVGAKHYYRITHASTSTNTHMTFGLFVSSRFASNVTNTNTANDASEKKTTKANVPFAMKAVLRAFLAAEKEGIAVVMPDTSSPR